ncbi:MAG: 3-phosphoshikimate 1-carboxyvinyltransferase [Clostridiales bacterium]|nr:3-phosphoshikimate 1-carboxyvinyltransferase [Clostridiales bacterium]
MDVKLAPTTLTGRVDIPSSKSYAHRMLITAAFSRAESVLWGDFSSDDMSATLRVLTAFGAKFEGVEGGVKITPAVKVERAEADCGESGSTLRFAVPLAAALGIETTFIGAKRLSERPMEELLNCLKDHGVKVAGEGFPLTISGKLSAGDYIIDRSRSSQFVTGLLLALPLLNGDSTLTVHGEASKTYIDITLDVLKNSGAQITKQENTFFIRGGGYSVSGERKAEGDWSNAAFWMVAGLLGEGISIGNLNPSSRQGDRLVAELLRQAGGNLSWENGRLTVKPSELHSITFDADDIPDAVPAMSVALAAAKGTSVITGVKRLRIKESDRLTAVIDMLTRLGVAVTYFSADDALKIEGVPHFTGGTLSSYNDHRLAMAGAVAAVRAVSPVTITGAEAVKKSYPAFFADYESLRTTE